MSTKLEQKAEAVKRIEFLTEKYNLNPNLLKYFLEDKIYYTETIIPGLWASMDNITYDEKYVSIVRRLEQEYDVLVYHCILTGSFFSLLYVSSHDNEWETNCPNTKSDWVMAAIYNPNFDDFEFGDIKLASVSQTLVRIG